RSVWARPSAFSALLPRRSCARILSEWCFPSGSRYCRSPHIMDDFHCSFCGKRRREVRKLISGPRVFICDECVALCNDIIAKEEAAERPRYPRPKEIVDELDRYFVGQGWAKT